ncbi:Conidiation-specific protein 10 [Pseudomonas putida]|nr:Conidiation-specific protein 10 [Pseudomonas putida]
MANKDSNMTGSPGQQQDRQPGWIEEPGQLANDREKASEAGRKGGQSSGGDHRQTESGARVAARK